MAAFRWLHSEKARKLHEQLLTEYSNRRALQPVEDGLRGLGHIEHRPSRKSYDWWLVAHLSTLPGKRAQKRRGDRRGAGRAAHNETMDLADAPSAPRQGGTPLDAEATPPRWRSASSRACLLAMALRIFVPGRLSAASGW